MGWPRWVVSIAAPPSRRRERRLSRERRRPRMRRGRGNVIERFFLATLALAAAPALAQDPPLIGRDVAAALAGEISGTSAIRTVQSLSLHHRMRGSKPYAAAAEIVRSH